MKQIILTQGKYALVDDEDFEYLHLLKWFYQSGYAVRQLYFKDINRKSRQKHVWMHRLIMECPIDKEVDHINGNGLDNRKENLRIVIHHQNGYNLRKYKNNKSGFKGVYYEKRVKNKPYIAQIRVDKKLIILGKYKTDTEAAKVYNDAAKRYHGEFASFNPL